MAKSRKGGGGAAGGSGYGLQAEATAYIAAHILAGAELNWIEGGGDIPVSVAAETGGPGDDLRIKLADGRTIEAQVKAGLKSKAELWAALRRLVQGLRADGALLGVLLVDPRASATIRTELAQAIVRLSESPEGKLGKGAAEFLQQTALHRQADSDVFRRLRIVTLDLEPGQPNRAVALTHLKSIVSDGQSAESAFQILTARGLRMIKWCAELNLRSTQRLVGHSGSSIDSSGSTPSAVRRRFLDWQAGRTASFAVPSFRHRFNIPADWIARSARALPQSPEPGAGSDDDGAVALEHLVRGPSDQVVLLIAGPGEGKSAASRYVVHQMARRDHLVLLVRLRQVLTAMSNGLLFADAITTVALDGIRMSAKEREILLSEPHVLVADGIDECGERSGEIAQKLEEWRLGHPNAGVVLTSRPAAAGLSGTSTWVRYELPRLTESEEVAFVTTLARTELGEPSAVKSVVKGVRSSLNDRRFSRLGTTSPLVLAFVTRLVLDGVEAGRTRSELYDRLVGRLIEDPPHDGRPEPDIDIPTRRWAYMAIGWHLVTRVVSTKEQLEQLLASDMGGASTLDRRRRAHDAIAFLHERGILEPIGDGWEFAHDALAEHAAGNWLAKEASANERQAWIAEQASEERFHEVLLFAAGADDRGALADQVVQVWDRADAISPHPVLAAMMLAEMAQPSAKVCDRIMPELVHRLQLPTRFLADESADALSALAARAPQRVASEVRDLQTARSWSTAVRAMSICLACGEQFVDPVQLKRSMEAIADGKSSHFEYDDDSKMKSITTLFSRRWEVRQNFIVRAAEMLLRLEPGADTADLLTRCAKTGGVSMGTIKKIVEMLKQSGHTDASIRLLKSSTYIDTLECVMSVFKPRPGDLILLVALRAACGANVEATPCAGPWEQLSQLGALLKAFAWEDEHCWVKGGPLAEPYGASMVTVTGVVIQALGLDVCKLAGELDWAIGAQRKRLAAPGEQTWDSMYSCFPKREPKLDWTRARLAKEERLHVAEGLAHPCRPVRVMAVYAIDSGVLGDDAQRLCAHVVRSNGNRAAFIAFLNAPLLGRDPVGLLLDMVKYAIPGSAWPIIGRLADFDQQQPDDRILQVMVRCLKSEHRACTVAAEALAKVESSRLNGVVEGLRDAFAWWRSRDRTQDNSVIPESPRGALVGILLRTGAADSEFLLSCLEDHRSDVREAAVAQLVELLRRTPAETERVLRIIQGVSNGDKLITALARMQPTPLAHAPAAVTGIIENAHPALRIALLRELPLQELPLTVMSDLVRRGCGASDVAERSAAVQAARRLRLKISASDLNPTSTTDTTPPGHRAKET